MACAVWVLPCFAVFHAHQYIGLIESADGPHWRRAVNHRICGNELPRTDGSWLKTQAPLQRPAIYRENGEPWVWCLSAAEPGNWHVVMVPLKKVGTQMPAPWRASSL